MEQKKNFNYTRTADAQVKPQVNGQRVTFENGKLVVLTNRGKLDASGNAEVPMEGIFTINARDLAKVCSLLTDMRFVEEDVFMGSECKILRFFNPKEEVAKLAREIKTLEKAVDDAFNENMKEHRKFNNLLLAIREFNATRKLWEREFVLPKFDELENGETDNNTD